MASPSDGSGASRGEIRGLAVAYALSAHSFRVTAGWCEVGGRILALAKDQRVRPRKLRPRTLYHVFLCPKGGPRIRVRTDLLGAGLPQPHRRIGTISTTADRTLRRR